MLKYFKFFTNLTSLIKDRKCEKMNEFNYYKINETFSHKYYQIPQELFINPLYKDKLNSDSKLLYGFLLDRLSLSLKNNWCDENSNVYLILQEKYEDLTEEYSKLKTSYNKLKKEYKEMTQAFNTIYDIFKTFTKLIIKSPLIQNAKDTLHILIKKFANSSDEELKEIQHKSEEYLQNISEKQYSKKEIYTKQMELEDEEEM